MKSVIVNFIVIQSWFLVVFCFTTDRQIEYNEVLERDYRIKAGNGPKASDRRKFNGVWPKDPKVLKPTERTIKDGEIPQYIVDSCPLVHLYSEEVYLPGDVADYVQYFELRDELGNIVKRGPLDIKADFSDITGEKSKNLYLTSLDDVTTNPKWLFGDKPDYGTGYIAKAAANLIVVDKGNGWVDAFWFYFYPFNLGPFVTGFGPWGNHIGDWEHSVVRYWDGEPQYLWMSAHSDGGGYLYSAVEKKDHWKVVDGKIEKSVVRRPLIFSARGTHANYPSIGQYAHDIPFFFSPLSDFTDRGTLWDPAMNFYAYTYNGSTATPHGDTEKRIGTDWLYFQGHWGDKKYPWNDKRQRWFFMQWKFIEGPVGPLCKNLERETVCQKIKLTNFWRGCLIRHMIKRGQGLDAERNDLLGDNCGIALYAVRPKWLRSLLRLITWRGAFCFLMDYFTG
ncbi:uncharacterized protein Ecym_1225 [Eremothecium cymbalariae DBVPG|uniref:Vacuolar protein sorting-associated protein 62 n=1 Tax=Eremothecium cymbalariae (strain CBS 270.75 / DBVPG 7215 / KCTC 17166 / NRRL Y-17582) TaxID=931890 RepID=G8JN08_ERECY|nr:hypothetical protein Ecym_1225 [Eremothecium cymbalariae DBVPG\